MTKIINLQEQQKDIIFIRLNDVKKITGLAPSSIYALISKNQFPKQVNLSEKSVAWVKSEIDLWVHDRIQARNSRAGVAA